jgi:nucleotide-binding universal stress UspA family protein
MKILLATDGSDSAKSAVDVLINFPFPRESSATVMTVIDDKLFTLYKPSDLDEDQDRLLQETEQTIKEESEQLLQQEATRLREAGWSGSTKLCRGNPADEILQVAEEMKPDLIVMGSHGITGVKHFLLGSVSDRVLEHASCSVLIVKSSPKMASPAATADASLPWRMLIAYDDSEPAKKAISLCASLPLDDNAEIKVVSVMPMIHMYRQDIRQELNNIWQQEKHAKAEALKDAVSAIEWSTPHVSSELMESADVSEAILNLAEQSSTDLIVLGYKGRSKVKRFLLGSITSHIADHASCSVLAVRD